MLADEKIGPVICGDSTLPFWKTQPLFHMAVGVGTNSFVAAMERVVNENGRRVTFNS